MSSTRYSCQILIKLEFSRQVFEKYSNRNFMKIHPVGADFFADGQTDRMTKLIVAFRSFGNAPKNETPVVRPTNRCVSRNIVGDIATKGRESTTLINFSR